jgi:hypothetical protein
MAVKSMETAEEATTSMEMAPRALPHPGRMPEQRLLSPEICLRRLMRHGVDVISPSSWEPQEEGIMSTAANFPSVINQGLIVSRKKPNV